MAEFVADGADAGEAVTRSACQFRADRKVGDALAVDGQAGVGDVPRLRPDGVVSAAFRLVVAGYDEDDIVDVAVLIEIIIREIDTRCVGRDAGVLHQLAQVAVGDAAGVLAVMAHVIGKRHDVADVERELSPVVQVVAEVVEHAARRPVVGVVLLVEQVIDGRTGIGNRESPVAELDRNHERTNADRCFGGEKSGQGATFGQKLLAGRRARGDGVGLAPEAPGVLIDRPSGQRGLVRPVLVTLDADGQRGAVRLDDRHGVWPGSHRTKLR